MDIKHLSKEKQSIVSDALAFGYVAEHEKGHVDLTMQGKPGVRLYADGRAFSLMVLQQSVSAAKCIRSARVLREFLDLPAATPLRLPGKVERRCPRCGHRSNHWLVPHGSESAIKTTRLHTARCTDCGHQWPCRVTARDL